MICGLNTNIPFGIIKILSISRVERNIMKYIKCKYAGCNYTIDFVTIASLGDAIDFGDVSTAEGSSGGASSSPTRFVMYEGDGTTAQHVQIMTTGNTIDFGDITDRQGGGSGGNSNGHGGLG